MSVDLSKLTPAPWRTSGSKSYVLPSHGEPYKIAQLGGSPSSPGLIARDDESLAHDAEFIALARNAFDGDPEALAWWEMNRKRREESKQEAVHS